MDEKQYLSPNEIANYIVSASQAKASYSALKLFVLGILAGIYISLAACGSAAVSGDFLAGAVFSFGLMMIVTTGAELFTGNNLMILGVLEKKITFLKMFRNWIIVYFGNFAGSLFIAVLIVYAGLADSFILPAVNKLELGFLKAFVLGIMCNMLVCTAILISCGAKDITGKILACLFPVCLFVTIGFEHSIANMFIIGAGLLAANIKSIAYENFNWIYFLLNNLLPVTIGNIIGGSGLLGGIFWFSRLKEK